MSCGCGPSRTQVFIDSSTGGVVLLHVILSLCIFEEHLNISANRNSHAVRRVKINVVNKSQLCRFVRSFATSPQPTSRSLGITFSKFLSFKWKYLEFHLAVTMPRVFMLHVKRLYRQQPQLQLWIYANANVIVELFFQFTLNSSTWRCLAFWRWWDAAQECLTLMIPRCLSLLMITTWDISQILFGGFAILSGSMLSVYRRKS